MAAETATMPAGAREGFLRLAVMTVLTAVLLFLAAGTVRWAWGWVYLLIVTSVLAFYGRTLVALHPDLIEERRQPPPDAKAWDKPLVAIVAVGGPIAQLAVCALDRRAGFSPRMATGWHLAGAAAMAFGGAFTNWAVVHNRFFSGLVRIQRERGHVVIDSGPYRIVRHPGYTGSMLHTVGTSFLLGSWWSLAVALPVVAVMFLRTAWEDRTLREELEGYQAYAERVRFRLIPGVW